SSAINKERSYWPCRVEQQQRSAAVPSRLRDLRTTEPTRGANRGSSVYLTVMARLGVPGDRSLAQQFALQDSYGLLGVLAQIVGHFFGPVHADHMEAWYHTDDCEMPAIVAIR